MIMECIPPAGKAGASWTRTRKITCRPRGKEPPAGPRCWERQCTPVGADLLVGHRVPCALRRSQAGPEWAASEGANRKTLKAGISWLMWHLPKLDALWSSVKQAGCDPETRKRWDIVAEHSKSAVVAFACGYINRAKEAISWDILAVLPLVNKAPEGTSVFCVNVFYSSREAFLSSSLFPC